MPKGIYDHRLARPNYHPSEKTKKKVSESLKKAYKNNPRVPFTQEVREKISRTLKSKPLSLMLIRHIERMKTNPPTGKDHPRWNGYRFISHSIRGCIKYKRWRSEIFTRDIFTCIICKTKGGKLNVDHYPKSFSQIIRECKINSYEDAMDCKELWNLNNGRTLCVDCHKKTDTYLKNLKQGISLIKI